MRPEVLDSSWPMRLFRDFKHYCRVPRVIGTHRKALPDIPNTLRDVFPPGVSQLVEDLKFITDNLFWLKGLFPNLFDE